MNVRCVAAFSLWVLFASAPAATPDDYAYAWPLQTTGDSVAWQVELTPEIYAAISTVDLRDVEIVDAAGEAVPLAYYRVQMNNTSHDTLVSLPMFVLPTTSAAETANSGDEAIRLHIERGPDGKLRRLDADVGGANAGNTIPMPTAKAELLLDASALHEPLAGLLVGWGASEANVSAQFAISGSDDLQQWRTLVASATVLRLTQDGNVLDRHEIALNGAGAAYLRLRRLDDGPALPLLNIRARTVAHSTAAQPARLWIAAALDGSDTQHLDHTLPAGDDQHPIAYRYHLPAALAIEAVRVDLADDNSLARLNLLSRDHSGANERDLSAWAQRGEFVAFRLREGDAVVGNDEFPVSGAGRARDWRIELATPLAHAPTLSLAYEPDRFVFLAQGNSPYRLVAGSARARRGDYPVDTALAQLRSKLGSDWQPPLAIPGARLVLQGDHALEATPSAPIRYDWKTWLLWAVLVAAAALIGGLALSLLREPKRKD